MPFGATKEEYADAFADIDPIELHIQIAVAPGQGSAVPAERYIEAIEDWSSGKITFEVTYAAAIAPQQEAGAAMTDGLFDLGHHTYQTTMQSFPVSEMVQETFFMHQPTPVAGQLELIATSLEKAAAYEQVGKELRANGLQALIPLVPNSGASVWCAGKPVTSATESQGKLLRPSGPLDTQEFQALGFTTVDISYGEGYEAFQRGVIDCEGSVQGAFMGGARYEVTDHWTLEGISFTATPGAFNISADSWDALPLPARQLMWDRLDAWLAGQIEEQMLAIPARAVSRAIENGIEFHEWKPDAIEAVKARQEQRLNELAERSVDGLDGSKVLEDSREFHKKWRGIIAELGYKDDLTWEEYPAWAEENEIEIQPFVDRVMTEILAKGRPE
ncbi:hypothetical protein [Pseudarthrobacter siccitolerans]